MLSDGILKHFFVQPYHPASPLPFGPLPCGPLSPAVQQGGRPAQPVSFWHGAFPSPPALPGALLSLRISAHRLTAGYLLWPACGCPAGWRYRRIYAHEPLAPVSFSVSFSQKEWGKGSRTDPAGAPLLWEVHHPAGRPPQKGANLQKNPGSPFSSAVLVWQAFWLLLSRAVSAVSSLASALRQSGKSPAGSSKNAGRS